MTAYLQLWCQAVIGGVFAVAVLTKVWRPAARTAFVTFVADLRVVPARWSRPAAYGVVAAEAGTAVLTLAPPTAPAGLAVSAALLTAFTLGIVVALRRPNPPACRCFGASTTPLGRHHVVRNLTLVGVCVLGLTASVVGSGAPREAAGTALALAGAAVTALFVARMADLAALLHGLPR